MLVPCGSAHAMRIATDIGCEMQVAGICPNPRESNSSTNPQDAALVPVAAIMWELKTDHQHAFQEFFLKRGSGEDIPEPPLLPQ